MQLFQNTRKQTILDFRKSNKRKNSVKILKKIHQNPQLIFMKEKKYKSKYKLQSIHNEFQINELIHKSGFPHTFKNKQECIFTAFI